MKTNTWFVCSIPDKNKKFGFRQITPKGKYNVSMKDAVLAKIEYELIHPKVVILKRTCTPLNFAKSCKHQKTMKVFEGFYCKDCGKNKGFVDARL